jgi:hypothetical protein
MMRIWRYGLAALVAAAVVTAPGAAQVSSGGAPPFARQGADKPSKKTLELQQKAEKLDAQYKKKPNAKTKPQLAEAWYQYGHARMYDNGLSPRSKYRPALAAFRTALKYNPNHKKAKADKEMIENIYRQMGMPVPQ